MSLDTMARKGLWPTPTKKGNYNKAAVLKAEREMYPTPTRSDASGGPAYKRPPGRQGGALLKEITPGPLNPAWVEWLMGFPVGWTDLGPSATRASRSARKSSDASSKPCSTDHTGPTKATRKRSRSKKKTAPSP